MLIYFFDYYFKYFQFIKKLLVANKQDRLALKENMINFLGTWHPGGINGRVVAPGPEPILEDGPPLADMEDGDVSDMNN